MVSSVGGVAMIYLQLEYGCTGGRGQKVCVKIGGSDAPVIVIGCRGYNLLWTPLCQYGMYMQQGSRYR